MEKKSCFTLMLKVSIKKGNEVCICSATPTQTDMFVCKCWSFYFSQQMITGTQPIRNEEKQDQVG